jgi:F0F1-type ATP synthase membrane subunit b/b'
MKKRQATKVATARKQLVRKGKSLRHKAGATARKLKKTATETASATSRRLKKGVQKTKQSAAVRRAGKLGRAVGGLIGRAIGTTQKLVTEVVGK